MTDLKKVPINWNEIVRCWSCKKEITRFTATDDGLCGSCEYKRSQFVFDEMRRAQNEAEVSAREDWDKTNRRLPDPSAVRSVDVEVPRNWIDIIAAQISGSYRAQACVYGRDMVIVSCYRPTGWVRFIAEKDDA